MDDGVYRVNFEGRAASAESENADLTRKNARLECELADFRSEDKKRRKQRRALIVTVISASVFVYMIAGFFATSTSGVVWMPGVALACAAGAVAFMYLPETK